MLRLLLSRCPRALVYDPLHIMSPGLILEGREQLELWVDRFGDESNFRVIYRPAVDESDLEGMRVESDVFCYVARQITRVDLFFDEIDSFCTAKEPPPELHALLNFGRRHNISIRGAVRRPQVKIPRDWITETTRFTIFRTCDPGDAVFLQRYTGISYEDILALQQFEYFEWIEGNVTKHKMRNPYAIDSTGDSRIVGG